MLFSLKEKLSSSFHISDIFCLLNQMVYYIFFKWLKHSSNDWDIVKYLCPDFRPVLNVFKCSMCTFMSNTPIRSQNQQTPDGFSIQNPQWNPKPRRISIFSKTLWTLILSPKPCWLAISLPKHDFGHFLSLRVYLYLYLRRICVFSSSPAAHCTPPEESAYDDGKVLSSPNLFMLLTIFSPIERFLADSILLGGT